MPWKNCLASAANLLPTLDLFLRFSSERKDLGGGVPGREEEDLGREGEGWWLGEWLVKSSLWLFRALIKPGDFIGVSEPAEYSLWLSLWSPRWLLSFKVWEIVWVAGEGGKWAKDLDLFLRTEFRCFRVKSEKSVPGDWTYSN